MARKKRPTGDQATNARKRYYRAAERHLKRASTLSGVSAERERKLAEIQFENALNTYDPETTQRLSKPMQRLANEFGIDVEQRRREIQQLKDKSRENRIDELKEKRAVAISETESKKVKAKNLKDATARREYEAETLFKQQNISHRILGGLVEVWNKPENKLSNGKIDKSKILPSIFKHFKVNTLSDLLTKIEQTIGDMLYGSKQDEIYDIVKLQLQLSVKTNG